MSKTVIVGGVAAGASCAARLRRLKPDEEIIMLERGSYISYANCGLPYHVSDVIASRDALLVTKKEVMKARFAVDVRTESEVVSIDRANKRVHIVEKNGNAYDEAYDNLVIATGSSPLRPRIPGIDSPLVRTLWTVPDTDEIRAMVQDENTKSAVVVGGGFIGLEMAENLHEAGLAVTLVEAADQVMAPLDYEMALLLNENICENRVNLILNDGVSRFVEEENRIVTELVSGKRVEADLVILAIGVRPNSAIAQSAGLEINARGGIVVDDHMRTNDPSIYAAGDVIEVEEFITKDRTMVPLAGPANKQGRIVADNLAGIDSRYAGTQGSSVAKVFDLTAAATGANEKSLNRNGLQRDRDYRTVILTQNSHAGYYPGALPLVLKLIFSMDGSRIYGAQIVGRDGVDKRIDTLGVAIRMGAGVRDLTELELAYAPPYSSAKDPVNMAGYVAENVLNGYVTFAQWDEPDTDKDAILLDVREEAEVMAYAIPNAKNIPMSVLRERIGELDKQRKYIIFCAIGVRAYNSARILAHHGFEHVKVYPAGARLYRSTHAGSDENLKPQVLKKGCVQPAQTPAKTVTVNCSGLQCPGPIMEVFRNMKELNAGECLEVTASDPGFAKDIVSWCERTGNQLISNEKRGTAYVATIQKVDAENAALPQGKTMVVFDGDLDKVLASFVIANGALAMGRPVTMFFTFWGLNALRKQKSPKLKKSLIEKMFGMMLPKGSRKLKLSKMNMGGMGTRMMRKVMQDKRIDSLEEMMQKAMQNGVKLVACSMSMDVMGIRPEELIDGVEIGGVGTYLGDAEQSNVNLFI
ncbi:FAD-dependent oxidoreductase [Agathobacter ruminis]|uniref:Pyridine nucleotide-disulfide oxidoreductase n=1 Tax=Agathobacter ruminis TaxID=1712665 RepID=A0A2G3E336_9FIRM|nr:FAD-dependent oxidoreductase [Agathobacter ruminis]MDC7300323.1 FAD-dependent oxidoreductase [Agathobacter ruminis]PHU37686.1 pyridine nucleotide-disulfide oxidoreductase [Agathobacter ruminis]